MDQCVQIFLYGLIQRLITFYTNRCRDCITCRGINVYKYLNVVWFNSITVYTYRIRDCIPKPKSKYIYIYTCGMTSLMYIEIVWFREGSLTPSAVVALSQSTNLNINYYQMIDRYSSRQMLNEEINVKVIKENLD